MVLQYKEKKLKAKLRLDKKRRVIVFAFAKYESIRRRLYLKTRYGFYKQGIKEWERNVIIRSNHKSNAFKYFRK